MTSEEQFKNFFKSATVRKTCMTSSWNHNVYCKICSVDDKTHYMSTAVRKCTSSECNSAIAGVLCPVKYRVEHCAMVEKYHIYKSITQHATLLSPMPIVEKQHGIAAYYKARIRDIIASGITTSKQIELTLIARRSEYDATICWPSSEQIRNFNREFNRKTTEVQFELGPVSEYLAPLKFLDSIDDTTAFEFNSVVATGTDENHLFIFMSCKRLIRRLQQHGNSSVTHIDGTYKITNRAFPVIIFGISDMSGHFFPVAFALVSHETKLDFSRFFVALFTLCERLDIVYNPPFIMMDASMATANAVIGMCNVVYVYVRMCLAIVISYLCLHM